MVDEDPTICLEMMAAIYLLAFLYVALRLTQHNETLRLVIEFRDPTEPKSDKPR